MEALYSALLSLYTVRLYVFYDEVIVCFPTMHVLCMGISLLVVHVGSSKWVTELELSCIRFLDDSVVYFDDCFSCPSFALQLELLTVKNILVPGCRRAILFPGLLVNHLPFRGIGAVKYCSGALTFNSEMMLFVVVVWEEGSVHPH